MFIDICRLVADPKLVYTKGTGDPVCDFRVAINDKFKKGDEWIDRSVFFDVSAWGKAAEQIAEFFKQGKEIFIVAEVRQENWEDNDTGKKRSKHVLQLIRWKFVGSKEDNQT